MKMETYEIDVDGIKTACHVNGRGPDVVALHGIPTSAKLYFGLSRRLEENYRFIMPDLLGQGDTAKAERMGFDDCYNHLDRLMALLPAGPRFNLILHDFGAILGIKWLRENNGKVDKLVILSTSLNWNYRTGFLYSLYNLLFGVSGMRYGLKETLYRKEKLNDSLLEILDRWAKDWPRSRYFHGADHFSPGKLRRIREQSVPLTLPTLLIWGRDDRVFPPENIRDLQRIFVNSHDRIIDRCGHWSPIDAEEEVAACIREFL